MKLLIFTISLLFSFQAFSKEVVIAVVDMGIDYYGMAPLKEYMFKDSKGRRGWDFGEKSESTGTDYNKKHEGTYHGTFIGFLIARPQFQNTGRIKLLDVVYSDFYGNQFQLNQYIFPENNLQVYRKKKALEKFSGHLAEVFEYAERSGAKVINFSSSDRGFKSNEMEEFLKAAELRGTFVIVSAGNDNSDLNIFPEYPCAYKMSNVICVGAVDKHKNLTSYSNFGKDVDVFAKGNFGEFEGTSFSAPLISRAVGLILSHNPSWSVKKVRKELFSFVKTKKGIKVFDDIAFHDKYR